MGLENYKPRTEKVELPGGDYFTVRGITYPDIVDLTYKYGKSLGIAFAKFQGSTGAENVDLDNLGEISSVFARELPDLACEVIAVAADHPDKVGVVKSLPFPVLVDALEKVAKLTFDTSGGLKKLVETVIRAFAGTADLLGEMRTSKAGSLGSGGK